MIPGSTTPARKAKVASPLEKSYEWCTQVAKSQAKNFYFSFLLLPLPQRRAMCAMYAFMRYCDDLSDGDVVDGDDDVELDRASAIAAWRADLDRALSGRPTEHPLWPAFVHTVKKYRIPHYYFFEMIEGVSSDLEPRRTQTFDELYDYCYHVASVVGLTIIHIFGFDDDDAPRALALAEKCGIAFQLTNILRDVREDAEKGRVYLPAEDLARFEVSAPALSERGFQPADHFRALMDFEAKRAQSYYRESAPLIDLIHPESRASLRALIAIYSKLLDRIVASNYDVLARRIRVPTWQKMWILAKSQLSRRAPDAPPAA
jgi:15-cis-phytoene synthase